ncbi:hypothetical protein N9N67_12335 [Bacteriovoracaceae bacterium]|nr:hypothetical protein [Bacteriovoracaceae bacterium]
MKKPLLLILLLTINGTFAWEIDYSGDATFEQRTYTSNDDIDRTLDSNQSIKNYHQISLDTDYIKAKFAFTGRVDGEDDNRSLLFINEAYTRFILENIYISGGFHQYTKSPFEGFKSFDNINARNMDSQSSDPEKIGELGAFINFILFEFEFEAGVLANQSPNILPAERSRSYPSIPDSLTLTEEYFLHGDDDLRRRSDYTGFYFYLSKMIFDGTFEIMYLDNFDKNNLYYLLDSTVADANNSNFDLIPVYFPFEQFSLSYAFPLSDLMIKTQYITKNYKDFYANTFEGITISFPNAIVQYDEFRPLNHTIGLIGVEYQYVYPNNHEGRFFLEMQKILNVTEDEAKTIDAFQNDLFMAYTHSFNNFSLSEIKFGNFIDISDNSEQLLTLSYAQNLNDDWKIETGLQNIQAEEINSDELDPDSFYGLNAYEKNDLVWVNLTRFF